MPRVAVPVLVADLQHGKELTVIFYADTPERALLLQGIVQAMARRGDGTPERVSELRLDHFRVREALPPTTVHDHEQQET